MAEKFLKNVNGDLAEQEALDASAGAGDAGKVPALDTSGRLSQTMMPVGVGPDTATITADEDLGAGDYVNIVPTTGHVRLADASNGYRVDGFVLDAVSSGQDALVYFEGRNTSVSGLTPGAKQYLSETAGKTTETPVTTSGSISQYIGKAITATEMTTEFARPITIA